MRERERIACVKGTRGERGGEKDFADVSLKKPLMGLLSIPRAPSNHQRFAPDCQEDAMRWYFANFTRASEVEQERERERISSFKSCQATAHVDHLNKV